MSSSLLNVITYYQRSIEKNGHDEKRLLHCIEKLYKLPVKLEHLQSTGVGKTVNSLRKYDKEVGVAAKALVAKWKAMVAAEVPHEDEDDDLQRESQDDDDDEDDDQSENSQNRDNTQGGTQNGRAAEEHSSNSTHHSNHGEHHLPSSSKDKHRNGHETDRQSSRSSRSQNSSHSSSSSSRHRYDDRKMDKRGHTSTRREEKDRHKHAENPREVKKEPEDSESDDNDQTDRKLSIVEEIEQDFDVGDDDDDDDDVDDEDEDDDEEKLIIDVSKEKTDEIEKRPKSESQELSSKYRHHSSKDSSRHESKREKESSKKESRSKERSPKTSSGRSKERSSKESSHSSREHSKKESSHKESSSRSERTYSKDKSRREDHRSKESSRSRKEDSPTRDKGKEKESSVEKRERKEDRTQSDSHKSKHAEKERDSKKDHKERDSSSSHKHRHRDKDKEREREKESTKSVQKTEESSKRKNSDSESKSDELSPVKAKVPKLLVDGIDSSMGTSFEEALGMISVSKGSKNSSSKKSPKAGTSSSSSSSSGIFAKPSSRSPIESKTPPLLVPTAKLEPLDPSIALELPTISPNYKPMPLNPTVMECVFSQNKPQKRLLSDEEALHQGISSKTIRTKVYSGVRTGVPQQVPSLFDLCIRVLQKNIDALEYTGGVPFEVLKQVLDRATPQQLLIFEEYNPYLMEDSDTLWKQHCVRHYRGQKRQEMETWREMFLRCKDEQDRKLSMLAENIKQSQKIIQQPIRKTQLAYVDSMVKPPRNIMKKQEQYGTKSNLIATPAARVASLANLTPNVSKIGDVRLRASAKAPDTVQIAVATSNGRPKKAPLMQKTINFMKGRFKR